VSDLRWEDVRNFFDPDLMGALPDVRVPDASVEDWQTVLDLVQSTDWEFEYLVGEQVLPLPRAEVVFSRPTDADLPRLRVRPVPDVLVIFRFFAAEQIDFDVDLRELQGQERLDVFCGFLAAIGRRLGKPVLMDAEGSDVDPVVGFDIDVDRVVLLADPRFD
jgi:hypothetical protein